MEKSLQQIGVHQKDFARDLLDECLFEWAALDSADSKFDETGKPIYQYFDNYWTDDDRYPFFLLLDNVIVGFCFIRKVESKNEIAEFYLKSNYRGSGHALDFANLIAKQFVETLSFDTLNSNLRAIKFWFKFYNQFSCPKKTWQDNKRTYWILERNDPCDKETETPDS